jgi:phosphate starvation-inducible PhoH-like protein
MSRSKLRAKELHKHLDFDTQEVYRTNTALKLKPIRPKTFAQEQMQGAWGAGNNLVLSGSAGTGKSFYSCYLALQWVLDNPDKKLLIIRSPVQTNSVGFLPGTLEEKERPFKEIFIDIVNSLCIYPGTWGELERTGKVEFMTTANIRGATWDNCVVLFDEIQNAEWKEIASVCTRLGKGSRIILSGDCKQTDLDGRKNKSGFNDMINVVSRMSSFDVVNFLPQDIVRSGFVKDFILACEAVGL